MISALWGLVSKEPIRINVQLFRNAEHCLENTELPKIQDRGEVFMQPWEAFTGATTLVTIGDSSETALNGRIELDPGDHGEIFADTIEVG